MSHEEAGRALNASVLVLNRHYMAVRVIEARRAFVLLFRDAAEVIDIEDGEFSNYDFESWRDLSLLRVEHKNSHDDWIRCVHYELQVPRILRLTRFDRSQNSSLRLNRKNLFARDNHSCQYCGQSLPASQLSFDHVLPRSRGGETSWENVVASCVKCNTQKGGRTPSEARMKLHTMPKQPVHNPMLTLKLSNPKYASWKTFLPRGSLVVEFG